MIMQNSWNPPNSRNPAAMPALP